MFSRKLNYFGTYFWNLVGSTDFQDTSVRGLCAILKTVQGPLAVIEKEECFKKGLVY